MGKSSLSAVALAEADCLVAVAFEPGAMPEPEASRSCPAAKLCGVLLPPSYRKFLNLSTSLRQRKIDERFFNGLVGNGNAGQVFYCFGIIDVVKVTKLCPEKLFIKFTPKEVTTFLRDLR